MSFMSSQFKSAKCTSTFKSKIVALPTGFDLIDAGNGAYDPVEKKFDAGLREGHIIGVVGYTGSGKSTLAIQLASGIVEPFENGTVIPFDTEKAWHKPRVKALYSKGGDEDLLKKWSEKWPEEIKNVDTYLDDVLAFIVDLAEFKQAHIEELTETFTDINGDKVSVLAPSVIIIDSLAALFSRRSAKSVEEEGKGDSNAAAMQTAKENNGFFGKILNTIFASNIFIIVCNHITTAVKTDQFDHRPAKLQWLRPDENIKGGSGFAYYADTFFRVNPGTKLDPTKDYKIRGFINEVQLIKSRGNESGLSYPMIFDFKNGYDSLLSNVQFLYNEGKIKAAGPSSSLISHPEFKFTKGNIRDAVIKNPTLEVFIREEVYKVFEGRVPTVGEAPVASTKKGYEEPE
jgi:RecA/RadA recombinase